MNPTRQEALRLRMQGKSYNEIQTVLKVAKSTLSLWLRDVALPPEARARLESRVREGVLRGLIRRNQDQTRLAWENAKQLHKKGMVDIGTLNETNLILVGAVLYWAEGYKRLLIKNGKERPGHVISFVNSDPDMVRIFVQFLIKILRVPVEKIRMTVRLYEQIDETKAVAYWREITSLPSSCVRNSTYLVSGASKSKRPFNRLPYGTLQIWVGDSRKFHYLLGLIDGVKKQM